MGYDVDQGSRRRERVHRLGTSDFYYLRIPATVSGADLEVLADELGEQRPIWPPYVLGTVLTRMTFAAAVSRASSTSSLSAAMKAVLR